MRLPGECGMETGDGVSTGCSPGSRSIGLGAVRGRAGSLFISVTRRPALTLGHGRTSRMAVLGADRGGRGAGAGPVGALRLARRHHQGAARSEGAVRQGPPAARARLRRARRPGRCCPRPARRQRRSDVFFIHPTSYPASFTSYNGGRHWNAPINDHAAMVALVRGDAAELRRAVRCGRATSTRRAIARRASTPSSTLWDDAHRGAPVRLWRRQGGVRRLPRPLQPRPAVHPRRRGAGRRAGRAAAARGDRARTRRCAAGWWPPI